MVTELSRFGRSPQDLITIVADLRHRNVGFRSLHEQLDTTTPGGRLVFHVFAALAEFIRELTVEGTSEALDAARARGQQLVRPPVMTPDKIRMASELVGKESVAPSPDCSASTAPPSTPTSPRSKTDAAPP
ncbi:MAG TPA: recombinase family protein [Pseudonocardiaceae bacterium]|nr:recombinase family protein [Pseudonocardiaceae bacterium]